MGEIGETEEPGSRAMASSVALKAAKKELRRLMKKKLSSIRPESVETQSELQPQR